MADEQQQVQAERLAAMSKRRHLRQRSVRQMMDTIFYVQTGCQCALPQEASALQTGLQSFCPQPHPQFNGNKGRAVKGRRAAIYGKFEEWALCVLADKNSDYEFCPAMGRQKIRHAKTIAWRAGIELNGDARNAQGASGLWPEACPPFKRRQAQAVAPSGAFNVRLFS